MTMRKVYKDERFGRRRQNTETLFRSRTLWFASGELTRGRLKDEQDGEGDDFDDDDQQDYQNKEPPQL